MKVLVILGSALFGTVLMTIFTYSVSMVMSENYRQPALLDTLMKIFGAEIPQPFRRFMGWGLHFVTGIMFVMLYQLIRRNEPNSITWLSGLTLGVASGILGVIVWKMLLLKAKKIIIR